jgi:hypothetical protein
MRPMEATPDLLHGMQQDIPITMTPTDRQGQGGLAERDI